MNLAGALDARIGVDRPVLHAEGRWWTGHELRDAIVRAEACLIGWGVRNGDRVAYLGVNRSEALALLFALARLGAIYVPLNTRLATAELAALVAHAALRVLVADAEHRDAASAAAPDVTLRDVDGLRSSGAPPSVAVAAASPEAPVLLTYTSGTTGAPKGALHTQAGLMANARAAHAAHGFREDDRVLTALPMFHVGGLCIQTVPALLAGAAVIVQPRFDAGAWLHAVAELRPAFGLMVPATLRAVMAHPAWSTTDLSSLRAIMAGSSTIPRALIDGVHARGVPLGQIYGSTETGPVSIALRPEDAMRRSGYAGWPCFDESIRIVAMIDDRVDDVQGDAVGEILVRAPNVMSGYWREPSGTGFRDGWFATGDLGRRDVDGCIEIVGRSRDLIISGGENIYPAEVEDVLLSIAGVAEAAVLGMPDERWGEVPAAFVVRHPGSALTETAIVAAFADRIARFKHPKHVVFVESLPRNAMGKVQGHLLPALLARKDGASATTHRG